MVKPIYFLEIPYHLKIAFSVTKIRHIHISYLKSICFDESAYWVVLEEILSFTLVLSFLDTLDDIIRYQEKELEVSFEVQVLVVVP